MTRARVFPYLEVPPLHLGGWFISPERVLLCAGVIVAYWLIASEAKRRGLNPDRAKVLSLWIGVAGLASIALMGAFARSFSTSFGGTFGGLAGGWIYLRSKRLSPQESLQYLDVIAFSLPFAGVLGRAGCVLEHGHWGVRTASWLGVQYPGGSRYDLALLEMFFLLAIAALFVMIAGQSRRAGVLFFGFIAAYGAFRFPLEYLRMERALVAGLSVEQWSAAAALLLGLAGLYGAYRPQRRRNHVHVVANGN